MLIRPRYWNWIKILMHTILRVCTYFQNYCKSTHFVIEAVMTGQFQAIFAQKCAFWTFEGFRARQVFHNFFAKMAHKVNAFVTSLIDTIFELFATQFAIRMLQFHINCISNRQSCQISDVFKLHNFISCSFRFRSILL